MSKDIGAPIQAMKGKVRIISVVPKYIGTSSAIDIPRIVYQAYRTALKELPKEVNFKVYGLMKFRSHKVAITFLHFLALTQRKMLP